MLSNKHFNSRLENIKNMINKNNLNDHIRIELNNATSAGQIWLLLFKYNLFTCYDSLFKECMFPTDTEMNEIEPPESAWILLLRTYEGMKVFKDLLDKNVLPADHALSSKEWFLLAQSDQGVEIFQVLLDKAILPNSIDLSVKNKFIHRDRWYMHSKTFTNTFDYRNTWYMLSKKRGLDIFAALIDKGIYPDSAALSLVYNKPNNNAIDRIKNQTAWKKLSDGDKGLTIFLALLKKGILPDSKVLLLQNNHSSVTCTWNSLARNLRNAGDLGSLVLENLLENNLFPDEKEKKIVIKILNGLSSSNPIINRFENMDKLKNKYNLSHNSMSILLSRDDVLDFYGFIYLFYTVKTKNKNAQPFASNILYQLPLEIWCLIAKYIIPQSDLILKILCDKNHYQNNQNTFVKHYMIDSLNNYLTYFVAFTSFVHHYLSYPGLTAETHAKRAESIKKIIKESEKPGPILINQYLMAIRGNTAKQTPYQPPSEEYQKPFTNIVKDKWYELFSHRSYHQIIKEGYSFFSNSYLKSNKIQKKLENETREMIIRPN